MADNAGQKHRGNTDNLRPPWPKGVSGNPGGRPKGESLTSILRRVLEEADGKRGRTRGEKFVREVLKFACRGRAGDAAYAKQVLDRAEGSIESGELTIKIVFVKPSPPDADAGNQN